MKLALSSKHAIRPARLDDCSEIARLAGQLGYPATLENIRVRLGGLLMSAGDAVYVAEAAEGALAGWIHGFLSQLLESDVRVEIGGLVIAEQFRRIGLGSQLVAYIEQWALQHGVKEVSVRCRTTRPEAHQFYENLGYTSTKTQTVFRKRLS
jgi:GNAT superfamily N-acetyltransferase